MNVRLFGLMCFSAMAAACAQHDGTYSPACLSYVGSVIKLENGRFEWTKFTDQVIVDDQGERVNQFPGFPVSGTYRVDGQSVHMTSSDGRAMEPMYLHRRNGETYLYTTKEHETSKASGEPPKCPLKLKRDASEK